MFITLAIGELLVFEPSFDGLNPLTLIKMLPVGVVFDSLVVLQADRSLAEVSALLLAEGGYAPANPPEWIAKLHPRAILLSVAAGDRRNLPDPETLAAIQGYTLLRTDQNGWIELATDGEQLWVEAAR